MATTKKKGKKRPSTTWGLVILTLVLFASLALLGAGIGFVISAVRGLPALSSFEPKPSMTSMIYDSKGNVIAKLHGEENRIPISIDQMPEHLQKAFVATEDDKFFEHRGVNFKAIIRALYVNIRGISYQGGSTITQQLVKTALLKNPARTYTRKIQEAILAVQVERYFTKKEILQMYLNQIHLGHGTYGVEAAAQLYFGKHARDLTLGESALLAGLARSPSTYSPYNDMAAARTVRDVVLDQMLKNQFISADQHAQAKAEEIRLAGLTKEESNLAPFFVDVVLKQVLEKYGASAVYGGGLHIYTTVDMDIQNAAEAGVAQVMDQAFPIREGQDQPDAAVVVLDPKTGEVKAIVGGRAHTNRLSLNRAMHDPRQPGSAFKPIAVYAAAFERGYSAGTVIDDSPVSYPQFSGPPWTPENYTRDFKGLITIREAIEQSINVVAVKVLEQIGVETGVNYATRMGISTLVTQKGAQKSDYTLSLGLGGLTHGVTPYEMASAYGVFANKGIRVEPHTITKVTDNMGNILEQHQPKMEIIMGEDVAYLMTHILRGVIFSPGATGGRANIGRPAAGKTGTSSDHADAWFVGYTPDLVAAVWIGHHERKPMDRQTGGRYPAEIWKLVMGEAHKNIPVSDFQRPKNFVEVEICTKSGHLPGPFCPADTIKKELFIKGTEPQVTCSVHVLAQVCADDPTKLATQNCPWVIDKVFIKRPEPYTPTKDGRIPKDAYLEVPTQYCQIHGNQGEDWSGDD